MKTTEEILARIKELEDSGADWMGTQRGDLVGALTFTAAKKFLVEDALRADWHPYLTQSEVKDRIKEYLPFAIGKAEDHRGLSAGRSIDHFTTWLWLLGNEEISAEFLEASYQNYGCPQLAVVIKHFDPKRNLSTAFMNMAQTLPCSDDCYECGA